MTSPLRTLLDAAAGSVGQEQLEKAVADALDRGLVRRAKVLQAADATAGFGRLKAAVGRARAGAA